MAKPKTWIEFPTAEYHAWHSMVRRCHNPSDANFARYAARGIKVCDRWRKDFKAFLSDMGPRPSPEHSLDRRDNNGDYTPENCRWVTRTVQQRNREVVLRADGTRRTGERWSAQININGRAIILGSFDTKTEAKRVYRQAAVQAIVTTEILMGALGSLARDDKCSNCGSPAAPVKIWCGPPGTAAPTTAPPPRRAERPAGADRQKAISRLRSGSRIGPGS